MNDSSWTCPNCALAVTSAFCPNCGEGRPKPRDLTLRGLLDQIFVALSSIDSRLLRSLRTLVLTPGALTVAYLNGQRMPFLRPFPLFLLANVAFFATQSLTGNNVFSSPLDSHLHHQDWSVLARSMVATRLEATGLSVAEYAPAFDRTVVVNGKALVVLMTVPFALLLQLVFVRSTRTFVGHFVFALHLYAVLLLLFCASLLIAGLDAVSGGPGLSSPTVDYALTALILAASAAYLFVAVSRVYGTAGLARLLTTVILSIAVAAIGLAYRFGLFVFTLYTT